MQGFIVTWDVDSRDASLCARLSRFVFGYEIKKNDRVYRYQGFVEREGVRYLGQSVLFVTGDRFRELNSFLDSHRVDHVVAKAALGPIMNSCAELGNPSMDAGIMDNCAETSESA